MSKPNSLHLGSAAAGLVLIIVLVSVIYALTVGTFPTVDSTVASSVEERLKPVGQVQVADGSQEAAPATTPAADAASGEGASGEGIYTKACVVCHASGAAGAPKLGDKGAWEPRVAQGMDALLATAIKGKGAMPPRGTCGTCSDEDLRAAVEYMVSTVQ